MIFKYKNNYFINFVVLTFIFTFTNCSISKAESIGKTIEGNTNDTIYELIQLLNPDVIDPEIEKIIQVDVLKETAPYFSYEWVKALRTYHRELIAQQELENYEAQGNIHKKIAYAYSIMGVIDREIEYYQYAIQAYNKTNNQIAPAFVFNKLGEAYLEFGELEEAEKYLKIAYWIFQEQLSSPNKDKIKYYSDIDNNLTFLTTVSFLRGKYEQAISYAKLAKYSNIGEIYLQAGQSKKAIKYLDRPTNLCKTSKFNSRNITKLNYLAEAYTIEGNIKNAINCYHRTLKASDKYSKIARADAYFGLGKLHIEIRENDKALSYLLKSLHIYRQNHRLKNTLKIHEVLRNIANIYNESNNFNSAIIYYEQSLYLALEARHLLLEEFPEQFYQENDLALTNLLLLLERTEQTEKYYQWQKLQNSFKFHQYIKDKYADYMIVNIENQKIIEEWQNEVKLLRYVHQEISPNIYSPDCNKQISRYNKIKKNLNTLAIQINNRYPEIAESLQISDRQLTTSNPNIICKWKPPKQRKFSPFFERPIF